MNRTQTCVGCDCVDEDFHFTCAGRGPFCRECWEALNNPDQALLTENRLAEAEAKIEELRVGLGELEHMLRAPEKEGS
jgi:hypothetical protein